MARTRHLAVTPVALAFVGALVAQAGTAAADPAYFDVPRGGQPHDVAAAPAAGAPVYYTAQASGKLGILDPKTGKAEEIALGTRSAPHGVVVGPDGARVDHRWWSECDCPRGSEDP